jgi:hypothetical protein
LKATAVRVPVDTPSIPAITAIIVQLARIDSEYLTVVIGLLGDVAIGQSLVCPYLPVKRLETIAH